MQRLVTAAAVVGVVLGFVLLWRGTAPPAPRVLASPSLTPGVLNPEVRPGTIAQTICRRGWTRTIRPPSEYTSRLKLEQMHAYGLGGEPADYQEDHLISLELGGHPTDRRNLWPELLHRATAVDRVEDELNRRVCSGELSLAEAQRRETELKHRSG